MAYKILDHCGGCSVCVPACPVQAIVPGEEIFLAIDPDRCTECEGYYDTPACVEACPMEAIVKA